jgi:dihydrofolate reductase
MGGADVIRQAVDEHLVDELRIHLSPVILGGGTPLFVESRRHLLVQRAVRVSATATHLLYEFET